MRLIWWVGTFTVGVITVAVCDASPRLVFATSPVPALVAFWLLRRRRTLLAEVILACAIGAYGGARVMHPPQPDPPITRVVDTDRSAVVDGTVQSPPEAVGEGSRLRVSVELVDGLSVQATVALAVAKGVPDVLPGDAVRFAARLRSVRGLCNPGVADGAMQARAAGIDLFAGVGPASAIGRRAGSDLRRHPETVMLRWAARAHLALARAIDRVVGGPAGALLHTAVLGERRGNDAAVEDGFRAAGVTHVLSVSGLHLAAIALVFFAGVRRGLAALPRLPLWIQPRAAAALIALPAIAFYTLLTGSAIATVRSALMMGCGLIGIAIGRRSTPVVAIAAAVLLLLGWSPLVLFDISFQLSVVSVLALAVLVPRLAPASRSTTKRTPARTVAGTVTGTVVGTVTGTVRNWSSRAIGWMGRFGAATLAAGLTTAPLVAHHFGEVTPAAPLGNLLLVPLVEMVMVPSGLCGALLGATLGTGAGWPLLTLAGWAARASLAMAEVFRTGAPVWLTRAPNPFETATLSIGIACLLASIRRSPSGSLSRRGLVHAGAILLAVAMVCMGAREGWRRLDPDLIVTFLDVGQGDAAVIQIPGGRTALIDGGGTYDGSFDPGARVVEPFLRAAGITHLDVVALSHPHPDHLGGLHRILARFPIDLLWTTGDDGHNPDYLRFMADARARAIPAPTPARWQVADAAIEPLGPFVAGATAGPGGGREHIGVPEGATVNDASLVLRVNMARRSVLFTGDIEADGEGELRGRGDLGDTVRSDVLKVPHHGSRTSSSAELLDAVRPRIAVISLGWKNRFHFPRPEVVERYRAWDVRLLRTDLNGAVTIRIRPGGDLSTTCARGCR